MSLLSSNLQAFLVITRLGTVHGAANELNLTQTAITQRIRSIERELGTTLFLRSRKGMNLTNEGLALLRYCQGAVELEGQALSQISMAGVDQLVELTIAGPTSVMTARIVDQCLGLYPAWPNLNLNFLINDKIDRLSLLRSGEAAIAIVPFDQVPNELESRVIKPEKYVLVGSADWKGRRLSEILENERVIDFDSRDQTTLDYLKHFKFPTSSLRARLFANDNEAIKRLFIAGVGFGTLTQEIAKPHLESGELILLNGGAAMESRLAIAWYPRPQMPKYLKAVLGVLR